MRMFQKSVLESLNSFCAIDENRMAAEKQDLAGMAQMEIASTSGNRGGKLDKNAPWIEKFRPKTLEEVAAHTEIIDTSAIMCHAVGPCPQPPCVPPSPAVKRLTAQNRLPHLLFYGPPGTGKTTTVLAIARQIYGASMSSMVLELNASDERGIDVVRQEIQASRRETD